MKEKRTSSLAISQYFSFVKTEQLNLIFLLCRYNQLKLFCAPDLIKLAATLLKRLYLSENTEGFNSKDSTEQFGSHGIFSKG